jgi:hypothetical protein
MVGDRIGCLGVFTGSLFWFCVHFLCRRCRRLFGLVNFVSLKLGDLGNGIVKLTFKFLSVLCIGKSDGKRLCLWLFI